jgi:hypothetical protein
VAKPATCQRCTELRAAIDRHLARCRSCHKDLVTVIGYLNAQMRRLRSENDRLRAELTAREHVRR